MERIVQFTHKRLVLLAGPCARQYASVAELTPARVDLLLHLRAGPLVQRDLALDFCVSAPTISKLVTALEKLGLVKRTVVPSDRRQRLVSLTAEATRVFKALFDSDFPDVPWLSIQASAESVLLVDWQQRLAQHGINVATHDSHDARDIVRRISQRVRRTDYLDGWMPGAPEAA